MCFLFKRTIQMLLTNTSLLKRVPQICSLRLLRKVIITQPLIITFLCNAQEQPDFIHTLVLTGLIRTLVHITSCSINRAV